MKDGDYTFEFCKYEFTEDEKKELAIEMAQKVSELAAAEDNLKAIKSDFKSQIDGFQARINGAATKLNNGYEMRNMKCKVVANWDEKVWIYYREDDGLREKTEKMSADDLQRRLDD